MYKYLSRWPLWRKCQGTSLRFTQQSKVTFERPITNVQGLMGILYSMKLHFRLYGGPIPSISPALMEIILNYVIRMEKVRVGYYFLESLNINLHLLLLRLNLLWSIISLKLLRWNSDQYAEMGTVTYQILFCGKIASHLNIIQLWNTHLQMETINMEIKGFTNCKSQPFPN